MSYDHELILVKVGLNKWALFTLKGIKVYEPRAHTEQDALAESRAFMSSWFSVRVRTKEQYEQEKQRNDVPESPPRDNSTDK